MMTFEMLTGQTRDHVINFAGNHHLQFNATKAFLAMQKAAATAGFKLMPASSFRDFSRQQIIWNEKFAGIRTVNDAENRPLDVSGLSEAERCQAILRWSAIPGASRHHWGTEVDYYDPFRLPADTALQLEPWEYEEGGYFAALSAWLADNMAQFDFYLPFTQRQTGGVAYEPWHISYWPLSYEAEQLYTPETLARVLETQDIAGKTWLLANLDTVYQQYVKLPEND